MIHNPSHRGGTDPAYLLWRLKRDDPARAQLVLAGKITVHRASIESGIHKERFSVPLDPVAMARAIRRRLDGEQIEALIEALGETEG